MARKKKEHDCMVVDLAEIKTDVAWLKKEMEDLKQKVRSLDSKIWAILLGILSTLAVLLGSKI